VNVEFFLAHVFENSVDCLSSPDVFSWERG
jgi:hypothetical protein